MAVIERPLFVTPHLFGSLLFWFCLTCVGVGHKGESAVLDVKGEGVDVQVAGANHSERAVVLDNAIITDVYIRHKWGGVFIHTVRKQQEHIPTMLEKAATLRPCTVFPQKCCYNIMGLLDTKEKISQICQH